jgi:hypothetical protein
MSFARVRALVIVGLLVVCALVFVTVALVRDTQAGGDAKAGCPEGYKVADIRLREPKEIKINVYNGTDTQGLASSVADDFRNRQFQVLKTGNEPKKKGYDGVAVLRYGPQGIGSYHLLRAYFLNEATPEYDPNREGDVVDVVIGSGFKQLATITEVNQALTELGQPTLEDKTCAAPDDDK